MVRNLARKNKMRTGQIDCLLDRVNRIRLNGLKKYDRTDVNKATVSEASYSDDTIVSVDTGNSDLDSSFDEASNEGSVIDFNCDNDKY